MRTAVGVEYTQRVGGHVFFSKWPLAQNQLSQNNYWTMTTVYRVAVRNGTSSFLSLSIRLAIIHD